jgi:chromatin assembly factor 1 subunit B
MVRVATPEIRWHCGPTGLNEAVLSIDFLPISNYSNEQNVSKKIFVTGGADKEIKLWYLESDSIANTNLNFIFSLSGHERSVNCVRFSPNGQYLASASDDATIVVWTRPKMAPEDWSWGRIQSNSDVTRTLLACGHQGDITDLAWSPDSSFLSSTSVDNSCVIWNVEKGKIEERRKDHSQYVQGVAWDPLNEFLATEGNDRSCRVYSLTGYDSLPRVQGKKHVKKCTCVHTIKSREYVKPISEKENENRNPLNDSITHDPEMQPSDSLSKKHRMFMDDSFPAFARRPCWTPDGNFLLLPSGIYKCDDSSTPVNTVYGFSRGNLSYPSIHLPGQERGSLGVRCSPVVYKLRNEEKEYSNGLFHTQTRSVFAVVTLNAVLIYDTEVRKETMYINKPFSPCF